jgi:hypothetical protein
MIAWLAGPVSCLRSTGRDPRFISWNPGRSAFPNRLSRQLQMWAYGQRLSVVQAQGHVHGRVAESRARACAPGGHRHALRYLPLGLPRRNGGQSN